MSKHHKKKKRTKQKSRIKNSSLQKINLFIVIIVVILLGFITNTLIQETEKSIKPIEQTETLINLDEPKTLENNYEEKTNALEIEYEQTNSQNPKDKKEKEETTYTFLYDDNETTKEPLLLEENNEIETVTIKEIPIETKTQEPKPKLPKLAIVIDDVSASHQVKQIQNIGYPITMAFLPPTKGHKNSAKIAKGLNFYMIHLPLEAGTHKFEEENTLHIGVSRKAIQERMAQLKQWYPNSTYINNHTGSKFTSDYDSMDKLFSVLKEYNYTFLDSKTTPKSVVKQVAKKHGVPYLTRNIFLDNHTNEPYITKQLKKAISIAKKTGYAIAIGHPHKVTIETLKNSHHLFDGLEVVFLNQL